jgi:hypothetical protein
MQVNRKELLEQLTAASIGLAARENVIQSSRYVFRDGRVMTFNDEIYASVPTDLAITGAVDAEKLLKVLQRLPEETVDLEVADGSLVFKGKNRRGGIRMEAEILLPVQAIERPEKFQKLPEGFHAAVDLAGGCTSVKSNEPLLSYVHIHPEWIEACDNFQFLRYPIATGVTEPCLVRYKALRQLGGMVGMAVTAGWCHFRGAAGLVVSCRRLAQPYPDLTKLLKVEGEEVTLPADLAVAADKAQVFSSDATIDNVRVSLRPGRVRVRGEGTGGWYLEVCKIDYTGPDMEFMISPDILKDVIARRQTCVLGRRCLAVNGGGYFYTTVLQLEQKETDRIEQDMTRLD